MNRYTAQHYKGPLAVFYNNLNDICGVDSDTWRKTSKSKVSWGKLCLRESQLGESGARCKAPQRTVVAARERGARPAHTRTYQHVIHSNTTCLGTQACAHARTHLHLSHSKALFPEYYST